MARKEEANKQYLDHSNLDVPHHRAVYVSQLCEVYSRFGVANTFNFCAVGGIEMGETNQFQPPAPVLQLHPTLTEISLLRSSLRLHSDPCLSSASPSLQYLPILTAGPHRRRDDGDGVHLYRPIRYEDGSPKSKALSSS